MSTPKIEYSRLVFKRSSQTGVVPTIPTASTIDNSWLPTDLLVGEGFINIADDKMFFRTDNGIVEIAMSGVSSDNWYTTNAYLSGNTINFDRNDLSNAYSVDLSSLLTGATFGNYLPLDVTGNTVVTVDNTVNLLFSGGSASTIVNYIQHGLADDERNGYVLSQNNAEFRGLDTSSNSSFRVGAASKIGSWMNYYLNGVLRNQFLINTQEMLVSSTYSNFAGIKYVDDYSADYTSRSLVDKEYVDTAIIASGGTFTGGTILGDLTIQGDVLMDELSATTISILNSGATARQYFDYSGNIVESGVTNSSIIGGSGNTISSGLRNVIIAGVGISATTSDTLYASNIVGAPYDLSFAISDETTQITSGTSKIVLYAPRNFTVSKVKTSLTTSGSTTTTVDVNVGGSTILTAPISLSSGVFVNSTTSITAPTISEDNRITVDIDAAGTGAKGLKIYLIGKNR